MEGGRPIGCPNMPDSEADREPEPMAMSARAEAAPVTRIAVVPVAAEIKFVAVASLGVLVSFTLAMLLNQVPALRRVF